MPSLSSCAFGDSIWYGHKFIPRCLLQSGESKQITTGSGFRQRTNIAQGNIELKELFKKIIWKKIRLNCQQPTKK